MQYYISKSYKFNNDCISLFNRIKDKNYPFFLDSSLGPHSLGRYSFLGCDPFYVLNTKNKDPFKELREVLGKYKVSPINKLSPFLGGAVGFLSYDLGFGLEGKLTKRINDDLNIYDCFFSFYDTIIICDHLKRSLTIYSCGFPETSFRLKQARAKEKIKELAKLISHIYENEKYRISDKDNIINYPLRSNFSKENYLKAVRKAKEYIKKGDIYQVNLSQRFTSQTRLNGYEIYKRLRRLSPSFFSAYLDCKDFQIISSSPERFLNLSNRLVNTRPMKGTRPRCTHKQKDEKLKKELINSEKDKAELVMIVDLERNDLGRVCDYGSVRIETLRELEAYNTVYQTTATIKGILHKDKDRVDLIKACFPGGSITGCPKIRAMEIIEELEPTRRCVYTGSLGYLSFSGEMDLNILIRTILKKNDQIYFQVGGGIVADSVPEEEYRETLTKAKAMVEALS